MWANSRWNTNIICTLGLYKQIPFASNVLSLRSGPNVEVQLVALFYLCSEDPRSEYGLETTYFYLGSLWLFSAPPDKVRNNASNYAATAA
jgi:hypothetical protein